MAGPAEDEARDAAQDAAKPAESIGKSLAAAAERSGLGGVAGGGAPTGKALLAAMGGVRGLCETILPGLVFLVAYTILSTSPSLLGADAAVPVSLGASVAVAVVFTVIRLVTHSNVTQAVAGLIGVAASAILALLTGNAANNFLLGFFIDGAYALAIGISMIVRWPLIGLIAGYLMSDGVKWRRDRGRLRAMQWLTLCWFALFAVRLIVQLPLYFAENVGVLAFAKLLMGVPLYASLVLLSWLVIRAVYPAAKPAAET